jgi:predicted nucleotidyltransferase
MMKDFIISKVRVKLFKTFLSQPKEMFYVRQLVRATDEEINAVRRELARMEKAGMVKKESRGNRLYYWFNRHYLYFGDLLSMVNKSVGIGGQIIKKKNRLGRVKFVVLSGRFARGLPTLEGGVDLLVVGEISMPELSKLVREEEKRLEREINYSVMSREEFGFRKRRRDPFLLSILGSSRLMIVGDEEELVSKVG